MHDEDMALWEAVGRKVLKIHGSIGSLGSLVIDREDYDRSRKSLDTGLIGARLKSILADKTIIYVGYSYRDGDLAYINEFVSRQLGRLGKQAFIVTLDNSSDSIGRYEKHNLKPIFTDATYFLSQIKDHANKTHCFLSDDVYGKVYNLLSELETAHDWLNDSYDVRDYPQTLYCGSYQDGLQHALERISSLRGSGHYSDRHSVIRKVSAYEKWRADKLREKLYFDVSYIDGYLNGLIYLLVCLEEDSCDPPLYYAMGLGEVESQEEYAELIPTLPDVHKAAMKRARATVKLQTSAGEKIILHHLPQL